MLKVSCSGGIGGSQHILDDINLVVVEDTFGNPLVVIIETQPGVQSVILADDPDFNRILKGLGIDKTVISSSIDSIEDIPDGAKLVQGPADYMS
jgi:hypothetical protein